VVEPSAVRRQLGGELTAVRLARGWDQRTLAASLGISQKTVSRFERGERIPDGLDVVQRWLNACRPPRGYPAGVQNRIRALYRAAAGETRSWTELLRGSGLQDVARERNLAAAAAYNVQTVLLPGLLQTEAYARRALAATAAASGLPAGDLEADVAARMARQTVLLEPGRRFLFLIAERLLRFVPSPSALTAADWDDITAPQLEHLAEVAELDTVSLAILPDSTGEVVWHPFILREPADKSAPYVTVEKIHGEEELRDAADVAIYRALWARLMRRAWTGPDADARVRAELDQGQ
jgi:transcriptional regulator with XRE-family HTH domain